MFDREPISEWPTIRGFDNLSEAYHHIESFGTDAKEGFAAETLRNAQWILGLMAAELPIPEILPEAHHTVTFEWQTARAFALLEVGKTTFGGFVELGDAVILRFEARLDGESAGFFPLLAWFIKVYLFEEPWHLFVTQEIAASLTAVWSWLTGKPNRSRLETADTVSTVTFPVPPTVLEPQFAG